MDYLGKSNSPEQGRNAVNDFGLNENRANERHTGVQNMRAAAHTAEEFIKILNYELEGLMKKNSDFLQNLKSVEDMYEEKSKLVAKNEDTIKVLENQIKTMGEENENLKRKFDSADEDLREKIACLAMKAIQYSEIKCEKQKLQTVCDAQEKSINELNEKIKQKDNDIAVREHEIKVLQKQFETDNEHYRKREMRLKTFITKYKAEIVGLKKVQEEQTKEIGRLQQFEAVHPALKEQLGQLERRKLETDEKLEEAENGIRQLKEEIQTVGLEKQNLLLRLSKLAGAKPTLDNPSMDDLSDIKRPTRLAEEFTELFDNEWTYAFEDLKIDDEREKTSFLLELLRKANALCHEVSGEHMNRIKTNICKLTLCVKEPPGRELQQQHEQQLKIFKDDKQEVMPVSVEIIDKAEKISGEEISEQSQMEEIHELVFDFNNIPHDEQKAVIELRKFIEENLSDQFETIATDVIARKCRINETQKTVLNYIRKCVNICWSMCRLEPPVYISFPGVHGDMQLDTSVYKAYTKSGRLIDYIVWPALYLHEGGPLLSKGVAQGMMETLL